VAARCWHGDDNRARGRFVSARSPASNTISSYPISHFPDLEFVGRAQVEQCANARRRVQNAAPLPPQQNIVSVAVPLADLMPTGRDPSGSLAGLGESTEARYRSVIESAIYRQRS